MVSKEALAKFKRLYFKHYGIELSDEEAYELANNLLNLYRAIYADELTISINQYETQLQPT